MLQWKMSKIVVALGGNALGKTPSEQLKVLESVSKIIVDLIKDGNKIVTKIKLILSLIHLFFNL